MFNCLFWYTHKAYNQGDSFIKVSHSIFCFWGVSEQGNNYTNTYKCCDGFCFDHSWLLISAILYRMFQKWSCLFSKTYYDRAPEKVDSVTPSAFILYGMLGNSLPIISGPACEAQCSRKVLYNFLKKHCLALDGKNYVSLV